MKEKTDENILSVASSEKQFYFFIKGTFDCIASFIGIIILSPIFLIVSLAIKIDDPEGPIIFTQERVGKDGSKFTMYKFRTMCVNAEEQLAQLLKYNEVEGAMFKMKEDPRITNIGRILRKTSFDEFPQLINVIKGEMSLVGPRPPLPREVKEYTEYDFQRLLVKPGCTGLWQVSGRSNLSFDEMVKLDIQYIKQQNILLDSRILLKTILIVFNFNGAY